MPWSATAARPKAGGVSNPDGRCAQSEHPVGSRAGLTGITGDGDSRRRSADFAHLDFDQPSAGIPYCFRFVPYGTVGPRGGPERYAATVYRGLASQVVACRQASDMVTQSKRRTGVSGVLLNTSLAEHSQRGNRRW